MSLSQSAIQTWFSCPRKWKYTYVDSVESIQPPSKEQRFGIGFHKLLEQHWLSQPEDWTAVELEAGEKSSAAALLAKYKELYPVPAEVLGAEVPWRVPGIGHGIFDAVYRDGDTVTVVEHKTTKSDFTSEWGVPYWDKVRTDWQVGIYQLAARDVYGTSNVQVLYDVIRVPQLRQKKNEDTAGLRQRIALDIEDHTDAYFGQGLVKWSDAALQELRSDLSDVSMAVAVATESGRYPRSRKCYEYQRECEWHPVCFKGASLQDEKLYQVRSRR